MPYDTDPVIESVTDPALAPEIADVAAATFPLACPPHSTADDVAAHIADHLAAQHFSSWITDAHHEVIVARAGSRGAVIGYALLVHAASTDDDVRAAVPGGPITEISKMYVLPEHHGSADPDGTPPAHLLMTAALDAARARGSATAWLGVNQLNARAQRYYRKMGFAVAGTKSFTLNGTVEHDYVMVRSL
ncbi:N-acetyltransferase [Gordonia sp. (in: high G+C Gram-positive bacteria)]|uniref:GNAT family N-acetyltransferase n=1 Tax=Gordonia sp. (in: high G+C Gram-positive bacteria) TaxID=84139 RepID=UPI0026303EFD|nr:GNAT family N-acetyltransferase [Gordonia sp. (in: high G+C Gram-positive bacteria)]